MPSLEHCFGQLDQSSKEALADLPSPLHKALGALLIAEEEAKSPWLSAFEIGEALAAAGVSLTARQVGPALSRAGDKVRSRRIGSTTLYRIMIPGRRLVEPTLGRQTLLVVYVEAGKPRTARRQLADLLEPLAGDIRISDPYYGVRTLDSLSLLKSARSVRFLTARTNEKMDEVSRAIRDFCRENPKMELRVAADASSMHDRYVLTDDTLILVGHGLKDIGGKESFVIRLGEEVAQALIGTITPAFDAKWSSAEPIK